jgi:hypothetical protein
MFTYGFLYENVHSDLIFKLRLKSRRKGCISTHAHMLEHTSRALFLLCYVDAPLKMILWDRNMLGERWSDKYIGHTWLKTFIFRMIIVSRNIQMHVLLH